jgi:putative transcriptional regulator
VVRGDTDMKSRLKELRARDGLNQTQLAKLAKVSRQTISLIEREEFIPSLLIAVRISRIFNEPVEHVFLIEEGEL